MIIYLTAFFLTCIKVINGQAAWNPSSMLSRAPGLHQAGGAMAFPQFLAMHMSYNSGSNQHSECPRVSNDCPESCRKADNRGCRICDCNVGKVYHSSGTCTEPWPSCPEPCMKRDHRGCKICSCEKSSSSGSATYSAISSNTYKNCYNMIMCMLSCKEGYTLGTVTNSHGCQTCQCMDSHGKDSTQGNDSSAVGKAESDNKNWEGDANNGGSSWSTGGASGHNQGNGNAWQNGATGSGSGSTNEAGSGNKNPWGNDGSSGNIGSNGGNDVWGATNGVGESSSVCSGPLCPGNSGGMNPMFPAANSGGSGSGSGSCTGPFCAGQGSGMGSMGNTGDGGSSGCTGPFCTMSGLSGGMDGSSAGMGGTSIGIGGASGAVMGGPGGVGAFSPFGLAASNGNGGSGCSGPFCAMVGGGGDGSIGGGASMLKGVNPYDNESSSPAGQYVDCADNSCSAQNGDKFQ